MIPDKVFTAMVESGALKQNETTFYINFFVVQESFEDYLHELVLQTLNSMEKFAYLEGFMAFTVLPSGLLSWKPTGKML